MPVAEGARVMKLLAIRADSPLASFAGGMPETTKRWHLGEQRSVSEATAEYLLSSFSDVFEVVDSEPVAVEVRSPAVDKAMKAPKKKTAPKKRAPRKSKKEAAK